MSGDGAHDWLHVERVWHNARAICAREPAAEVTVVELAALLHDLADWKFHGGDLSAGPRAAREWLAGAGAEAELTEQVAEIVGRVSFKGANVPDDMPTLEGRVVQDADRLDAIGAIGIARAFAYGGHAGRALYDPDAVPELHADPAAYHSSQGATITHFHEKLLLLRDRMHTAGGRELAEARHEFMEQFLRRFRDEVEGAA